MFQSEKVRAAEQKHTRLIELIKRQIAEKQISPRDFLAEGISWFFVENFLNGNERQLGKEVLYKIIKVVKANGKEKTEIFEAFEEKKQINGKKYFLAEKGQRIYPNKNGSENCKNLHSGTNKQVNEQIVPLKQNKTIYAPEERLKIKELPEAEPVFTAGLENGKKDDIFAEIFAQAEEKFFLDLLKEIVSKLGYDISSNESLEKLSIKLRLSSVYIRSLFKTGSIPIKRTALKLFHGLGIPEGYENSFIGCRNRTAKTRSNKRIPND